MTRRRRLAAFAVLSLSFVVVGCGSSGEYDDTWPMWSPDGRMIAFSRIPEGELGDLYVMRADGTGIRRLARDATNPAWSPDGAAIAFEVLGTDADGLHSDELWMVDVKDGSLTRLTQNTIDDYHAAWSSDGTKLAFIRGGIAETSTLAIMDVASKEVRVIFGERQDSFDKRWPAWSPDGRQLAFVAGILPERLLVVSADGSARRKIARTRSFESIGAPQWSPDGQVVLFNAGPMTLSDREEIYSVRPGGTGLTQVTRNGVFDSGGDWSPDGRWILFTTGPADDESRWELHTLRADGTGETALTDNRISEGGGDWSPNGRSIVFARDRGDGLDRIYVMDARGGRIRELTDERRGTAPEEDT